MYVRWVDESRRYEDGRVLGADEEKKVKEDENDIARSK